MIETINGILAITEESLNYATERELKTLKEISRSIYFRKKAESSDTDMGIFEKVIIDDMKVSDPTLPYLKEINASVETGVFEFALSETIANKLIKAATGKNSATEIKLDEWMKAMELVAIYGFCVGRKLERKAATEKARVLL